MSDEEWLGYRSDREFTRWIVEAITIDGRHYTSEVIDHPVTARVEFDSMRGRTMIERVALINAETGELGREALSYAARASLFRIDVSRNYAEKPRDVRYYGRRDQVEALETYR